MAHFLMTVPIGALKFDKIVSKLIFNSIVVWKYPSNSKFLNHFKTFK